MAHFDVSSVHVFLAIASASPYTIKYAFNFDSSILYLYMYIILATTVCMIACIFKESFSYTSGRATEESLKVEKGKQ